MLNWGYMHRIMSFQLPPEAEWHNLISHFYARYNHIHDLVLTEFGPNGFIVLFLFFLFLLIIVVIYIITLVDTFKTGREELEDPDAEPDGLFYKIENRELMLANDNDEEFLPFLNNEEMNKIMKDQELSTELILASQRTADYLNLEQDYIELKKRMQKHAKASQRRKKMLEEQTAGQVSISASEQIDENNENDVVFVILNLLGHGVTEQKIAQAVFYYHRAKMSEEDVMQAISTISDFIGLCNSGKFETAGQKRDLPSFDVAVMDLVRGDISSCLILLQSLLNFQMQKAENESGLIRDLTYAMAANIACLMGNIANTKDLELAHNSFELATELSPKNATAWSRLGDIYMRENTKNKAMIAYQTVLDISDKIIYAQQIANAQRNLAEFYYNQGMEAKAEKMRRESSRFYKIYGIDTPLSPSERTVYQTLKQDNLTSLSAVVNMLLKQNN